MLLRTRVAPLACAFAACGCWLLVAPLAQAQFVSQQVGGVSIDAKGVVQNVRVDELNQLKRERAQALTPVPGDLKAAALRKVSLRQLEAAIAEHRKNGTPITDDMRYLAGMQRIQYVFVYPEHNDIVLAGPGEGWKLNEQGEVVGISTGRPVMLLDDLLVAFRAVPQATQTGISCSIDPRTEGLAALGAMLKNVREVGTDPTGVMRSIEESLGPQNITVTGVPDTSHFARVLVASDYRMKRLAMGFEEPPISGLPSYLQMLKKAPKAARATMPRWWLAPNYDALLKDPEGLAWEIGKASVKAMTEEEAISASGQRQRSTQVNPLAKKWADNMTAHYDELSAKESIFGQLRNCMDLAVVAALIQHEQLTEKCGWSMALLMDPDLKAQRFHAPHTVASQASAVQKGTDWIITASGGVQLNPWEPLEKATDKPELTSVRTKSAAASNSWWWN